MSKSINEIYDPGAGINETPLEKSKRLGLPLVPSDTPTGICSNCGSVIHDNGTCKTIGCPENKVKLFD